jgi:hypothetical protein
MMGERGELDGGGKVVEPIEGNLFVRNYRKPAQRLPDSDRARRRIYLTSKIACDLDRFAGDAEISLGLRYPSNYGYMHDTFFSDCRTDDFLSCITILLRHVKSPHQTEQLREEFSKIFREESLNYRIDPRGGVHFEVDDQFQRNIDATVLGLGNPKFTASLHALEESLKQFSGPNRSGKILIRGVFEAVESAFLVVVNNQKLNRLSDQSIDADLKKHLLKRYAKVPEADDKVLRTLENIKSWVKAAHPFRHGAPLDQVHEAPEDYAVFLADQGMAILRLIIA